MLKFVLVVFSLTVPTLAHATWFDLVSSSCAYLVGFGRKAGAISKVTEGPKRNDLEAIPVERHRKMLESSGYKVQSIKPLGSGTFTDVSLIEVLLPGSQLPITAVVKVSGGMLGSISPGSSDAAINNAYLMHSVVLGLPGIRSPRIFGTIPPQVKPGEPIQGYICERAPGESFESYKQKFPQDEPAIRRKIADAHQVLTRNGIMDMDSLVESGVAENILVERKNDQVEIYFIDFGMFKFVEQKQ